ncbi:MAG: DUF4369 domain-containing protein [Bacteroidaceae bacterium]|nr:DUF4369 domain-containing protein [Bacteroidaceae bacterium]
MRFFFYILSLLSLIACSNQYSISGDLSQGSIYGKKLYLTVVGEDEQRVYMDSCDVVHGQFVFSGPVDSIVLGHIDVDGYTMMPIVIEHGDMNVSVTHLGNNITGGALNQRLNNYFEKINAIQREWEILHQHRIRLMMTGALSIHELDKITQIEDSLNIQTEKLQTSFVIDNFDNVLGPGIFMMICNQYPVPIITPQVHFILKQAPTNFLRHPRISTFLQRVGYEFQN